ncbi:MAG: lipopolysaccharide biosynthesis protein [Paludibacteraceae bacterium]|nr:lipopolysaccharide biosynthesis protein [Paludibacteraceae bacterium]
MGEESLQNKTKKGLFWSAFERFGTQGISALFTIFLARLLTPEDYGLVAMPVVFMTLAQCFIDSGFASALVRKSDLEENDIVTAFYFNVAMGIICYLLLFFLSPFIADFYNAPILTDLLKVSALTLLIGSFGSVQQALLTKEIDFKRQAKISMFASLISGSVGISLALLGCGVWSLVIQYVCAQIIRTVLLWRTSKWRPVGRWSSQSFHYLWNFGSKMLMSSVLDTIYNNIYPIVIGKFFSKADLGNFMTANQIGSLPSSNLTGVLQRVTYPVLSTIQNDDERLSHSYRKLLRLSAFLVFPLMLGLSAAARPFVITLLSEKWEGCIILLQLACFYLMFYPVHAINLDLLVVKGRSDLFLRLEIIKKVMGVAVMAIAIPHGIIWMMASGIVSSVLALVINTYYTGVLIKVGFFKQMRDILPIFMVGMAMWALIMGFNLFSGIELMWLQLIIDIVLGVLCYFLLSRLFLKRELSELVEMLPAKIRDKFAAYLI